jgi:hypothetical protein
MSSVYSVPWSFTVVKSADVPPPPTGVPKTISLSQNFPNPFNSSCTIEFDLPVSGFAEISVYSVIGKKIATLTTGYHAEGKHSIRFSPTNLATGVYFYRLTTESGQRTRRILLMN